MTPLDRVTIAAALYVQAVEDRRRLRKQRAALACEFQAPMPDESPEAGGRPRLDAGDYEPHPCWKWVPHFEQIDAYNAYDASDYHGDTSERGWCPTCERRREVHKQYQIAGRKVGPAYLRLRCALMACGKPEVTP